MYHTNRAGRGVTLAVLLTLCPPALEAVAGQDTAVPARNTSVFDVPNDAELFAAYQSDHSNQKVQSWGQYRGWVQTFYKGNLMSDGWTKFSEVTVSKVKSAEPRQAVTTHVNELGRIISLEWAKDSSVRKITTADLRSWNEAMATARQSDDGSGQQIIGVLRAVRRMAENSRSRDGV
jgi:hypothetical protein